eukprot:TRINITY_DN5716_c0_g1_i1.p1 TRINITY_DN5716_c0_g1~~TRINITY_DN5716_c0_g1_i1.p1  ORF type:complete len:123 (+),score=28.80 TRINITY_DN5716_c0_g1_i1:224-592(+)
MDPEVKRAVDEVRKQTQETEMRITLAEQQKNSKARQYRKGQLTIQELTQISDSTPMYNTIGKGFLKSSKTDIIKRITTEMKEAKEEADKLEEKQKWMKKSLEQSHSNLADMLRKRQGQTESS